MYPTRRPAVAVRLAGAVAVAAVAMLATGCRRNAPAAGGSGGAGAPAETLSVFAAASLREAFTALGAELEKGHPGARVVFNFAGSQELRTQIEHGAPADVFASADMRHMAALRAAGLVGAPVIFARNELVIAVAGAQAARVRSLGDLPRVGRLVIGAPDVPIGSYTQDLLDRAGAQLGADFRARVEGRVVSRELNVRQVLAKLRLGEADAAIVYRTDALNVAGYLAIVAIPPALNVIAEYPIAPVAAAPHAPLARAFVDLVLSAQGQATLRSFGFLPPAAGRPDGGEKTP